MMESEDNIYDAQCFKQSESGEAEESEPAGMHCSTNQREYYSTNQREY